MAGACMKLQIQESIPRGYPVCTWCLCHHVHSQREEQEYCPSRDTCQCSISTLHMLDLVQQSVIKHVQLQGCMGQRTSSFPERKGTCDGIKEVRRPMQGIFSVSASNETIDSADSSGTLVGLVYMLHEQVRPS
jgi:hypothetical protein